MPAIAHQNKILGNTSGGGSTILVTTSESTLYGQTVTLSDGTTTLTGTFSNAGECEFTGVMMVGTLTASSGGASTSIQVPYFGVYSMTLSFFSATITVTFDGGTCTCVGNGESYTASSSPYTFTVHGAATYTITNTIDGVAKTDTVTITTDGQSENVTISFGTINVTYDNAFRGTSITCTQGGTTITKTAPAGGNTMVFYPPTTGNWVISGTVSGTSYSKTANVTSLSTSVSVSLETVPDGKTTTPTDDIEKWLQCGQITGKSYTTLSQVLDDAETYERLLSDSNACDYMKRSTTWASTICADADAMMRLGKYDYACDALLADSTWVSAIVGSSYADYVIEPLVPTMTSNTTPSGEAIRSSVYSSAYEAYRVFDNDSSTLWSAADDQGTDWIGYHFDSPIVCRKFYINQHTNARATSLKVQGSNTGNSDDWHDISDTINTSGIQFYTGLLNNDTAYSFLRIITVSKNASYGWNVATVQFYGRHTAQTDIVVSAPESYVYYMQDGSPVNLCYTDSDGIGTIDWSDLPKGEITLYSNVAKDPDNLSNDYSKTVKINENTTEIYLMPEGALYWWGYMSNDCEVMSTANGWSASTNDTFVSPTLNNTSVSFAPASLQASYIVSKRALDTSKLYIIGQNTTGNTYAREYATKTFDATANVLGGLDSSSLICKEFTSTPNNYMCAGTERNRAGTINAFWYEKEVA